MRARHDRSWYDTFSSQPAVRLTSFKLSVEEDGNMELCHGIQRTSPATARISGLWPGVSLASVSSAALGSKAEARLTLRVTGIATESIMRQYHRSSQLDHFHLL